MAKLVIILNGPPGSGKGTQADLLADRLGLYLLDTSKILEERFRQKQKEKFIEVGNKRYYFSKEEKLWKEGILCSPPFVTYLLKNKIQELFDLGKNLILSGSPRTLFEAKEVTPFLKRLYGKSNIKTVLLKLAPEESIWRNSHRRICELMRHSILYNKETVRLKNCPLDGSKLVKRKGLDDPETIKIRLNEYKERTLPIINCYKKGGLKVKEINGEQSVANVFRDILKALK